MSSPEGPPPSGGFPHVDSILESIPLGVIYQDAEGRVAAANGAAQRMLGQSLEELRGATSEDPRWDVIRADGSPFPAHEYPAPLALRLGKPVSGVVMGVLVPATGGRRWFSVAADVVWADGDRSRPAGTYAFFEDITARKRAQDELDAATAKLKAALGSLSDAVFISDAQGRFVEFNEAFAKIHRFRDKRECLQTLAEYPDILDVFRADGTLAPLEDWAVPRALRGEVGSEVEYRLRRRDTGESWIGSYSFAPIRDAAGRITGSVVIGRDITARKQIEQALHDSEARFGEVYRTSHLAIGIVSLPDGHFVDVNPAFERMFGHARADLIGRTSAQAGLWSQLVERDALFEQLARGEEVTDRVAAFRHPDGREGLMSVSARVVQLGGVDHFV
ncbi:MAG: PAS domain S-box protein, partial [Proteobacteria bacterium]|nr:PAS domain S-box protein [Pseudomonadota bacterium]